MLGSSERWELERLVAVWRHELSVREYYERQGVAFEDHHQWNLDRQFAMMAYVRSASDWRKRSGDAEILERLSELAGKPCEEDGYKITRARRRVLEALVRLAAESGVLYCGYDGLAREAGVSPRSACTIRAELERAGVLRRVRTGGKAADGFCQSNKYFVDWNTLRDVLGVENARESRYEEPSRPGRDSFGRNVYYNYEGCAHYSRSERQRRRLLARERERARLAVAEVAAKRLHRMPGDVENLPRSAFHEVSAVVENRENECFEQVFCAVTGLKTYKDLSSLQPEGPLLLIQGRDSDECTPLRGSLDARPADGKGDNLCYDPCLLGDSTRSRLAAVRPGRLDALLAEADQMTRDNHSLESAEDMQWHAEQVLLLILDADRSLFDRQAPDRIGTASPCGSEK